MQFNTRTVIGSSITLLLASTIVWTSCSKEAEAPSTPQGTAPEHSLRVTGYFAKIVNGTTPCLLTVCSSGQPYPFTAAAFGSIFTSNGDVCTDQILGQSTNLLKVSGTCEIPACSGIMIGSCNLSKTTAAAPIYYFLTPNQGPSGQTKAMRIRLKSGTTIPNTMQCLTYNALTGRWTAAPGITTYMDTLSVPALGVCIQC